MARDNKFLAQSVTSMPKCPAGRCVGLAVVQTGAIGLNKGCAGIILEGVSDDVQFILAKDHCHVLVLQSYLPCDDHRGRPAGEQLRSCYVRRWKSEVGREHLVSTSSQFKTDGGTHCSDNMSLGIHGENFFV